MSRPFVAFYIGDYQKKTQHLDTLQHGAYFLLLQHCWTHGAIPQEAAGRAAIARLTLRSWQKIAPVLDRFFDAEGRNKRATEEIERAERISLQRALAGARGGFQSGRAKAIASHHRTQGQARARQMPRQAQVQTAEQMVERPPEQSALICEAVQNQKESSSSEDVARELSGGSPGLPPVAQATHGDRAETSAGAKPPHLLTRTELEVLFAARRANDPGETS